MDEDAELHVSVPARQGPLNDLGPVAFQGARGRRRPASGLAERSAVQRIVVRCVRLSTVGSKAFGGGSAARQHCMAAGAERSGVAGSRPTPWDIRFETHAMGHHPHHHEKPRVDVSSSRPAGVNILREQRTSAVLPTRHCTKQCVKFRSGQSRPMIVLMNTTVCTSHRLCCPLYSMRHAPSSVMRLDVCSLVSRRPEAELSVCVLPPPAPHERWHGLRRIPLHHGPRSENRAGTNPAAFNGC